MLKCFVGVSYSQVSVASLAPGNSFSSFVSALIVIFYFIKTIALPNTPKEPSRNIIKPLWAVAGQPSESIHLQGAYTVLATCKTVSDKQLPQDTAPVSQKTVAQADKAFHGRR